MRSSSDALFSKKCHVCSSYVSDPQAKFIEMDQLLFQQAIHQIPSLKATKSCMVTDNERAIAKAVELEVPDLKMVQCAGTTSLVKIFTFGFGSMVLQVHHLHCILMMCQGYFILLWNRHTIFY